MSEEKQIQAKNITRTNTPHDVREAFAEVAREMPVKAGFFQKHQKLVSVAVPAIGVAGGLTFIVMQGREAWREGITEGRTTQGLVDMSQVTAELVGVSIGLKEAVKTGWQSRSLLSAGRVGVTGMLEGGGAVTGLAGGVVLTVGIDVGQSVLHNQGFDVDNGYIETAGNDMLNTNNAGRYLFPGDTLPFVQSAMGSSGHVTKTQTGPYQWNVRSEFPAPTGDGFTGNEKPEPIIIDSKLDQRAVGALFERYNYFGLFHEKYPVIANGQVQVIKGQGVPDNVMGDIAKGMYENPTQAMDLFKNFLMQKTIDYGYRIAKEEKVKLFNTDRILSVGDAIPPELMERAANLVLEDVDTAYKAAGYAYMTQGLAFLDQTYAHPSHRYTDPKNFDVAIYSASNFLDEWTKQGKGNFDWADASQAHAIEARIEKDLQDPQLKAAFRQMHPDQAVQNHERSKRTAAKNELEQPRYSAAERHSVNQNIIGTIVNPDVLLDTDTQGFKNKVIEDLQIQLAGNGYLSPLHHTGTMNIYTMRGIDSALRDELRPQSVTEDQRKILTGFAQKTYDSLTTSPADPSSFDVRVLSFQANVYLLNLYKGPIDGLAGVLTQEAQEKFGELQMPSVQTLDRPIAENSLDAEILTPIRVTPESKLPAPTP